MVFKGADMNVLRNMDPALGKILTGQKLLSGVNYIPSQFCYPFEYKGRGYVSNTLTRQVIEAKLPDCARSGEGFDELIKEYFLVPEDKDECRFYQAVSSMMRAFDRQKGHKAYTILPTYSCNARCMYCYEEGRLPVTMTPEIVGKTIQFILDSRSDDKVHLEWFGGEPLLCPEIIDRICLEIGKAGIEYTSSMISNGSLITSEIIEKMTTTWKMKHVQISMDGMEKEYVARKRYCHYDNYYHRVINNIGLMAQAGIAVSVRCNVDEENIDSIPAFLDDLKKHIPYKDNIVIYFCLLNDARLKKDANTYWAGILKAQQLIVDAGFKTENMGGTGDYFRITHFMADKGNVVITPDGSLYPCEHCPEQARYGDVFRGTTNEEARINFCSTGKVRTKCRHCPFLPECTSFSHCPVQDINCRELREMVDLQVLTDLIEGRSGNIPGLNEIDKERCPRDS